MLVVDDEPDARELVTTLLESSGAQVTAAGSAEEALALQLGVIRYDHDQVVAAEAALRIDRRQDDAFFVYLGHVQIHDRNVGATLLEAVNDRERG